MKKILLIVAMLVTVFFIWLKWGATVDVPAAPVTPATPKASANGALPPSAVFRIAPGLGSSSSDGSSNRVLAVARGQLPRALSPMMADYVARKDYSALYATALQSPNDPEALFLRAQILSSCATQTDQAAAAATRKTPAERRQEFVAKLSPTAPDTAQRTAAYDAAYADVCGTLRTTETTSKEIAELYARAKALSDPTALARDLNCEIFDSIDLKANGNSAAEINDSRFERIRQALGSRSPIAVRAGAGMLANTYRNGAFQLQIGTDKRPVSARNMFHAANILACQYGANCATDVLQACAKDGKCAANNFEDYLAFYELSPHDAQTVESYRAALTQMIDSGDFSALQLVKGEQSMNSVRSGSYFSCAK